MAGHGDNFYELLGVSSDASPDEIHRAYRRLARRFHPDHNTGADADARFQELSRAYEVLHDPEQRARYDRATARPVVRRARPAAQSRPAPGPRAPYFSDRVSTRQVPRFLDERPRVVVSVRVSWLPRFLERWL